MSALVIGGIVALILIFIVVGAFLSLKTTTEEVPVAETTLPPPVTKAGARYIRVTRASPTIKPNYGQVIELLELVALDEAGSSVLGGASVTSNVPSWPGLPYSNLIDGNKTTLAHTHNATVIGDYMEVALDGDKHVKKIELYHRPGHYTPRAVGLKISVLDAARNVLFTADIQTESDFYTYAL